MIRAGIHSLLLASVERFPPPEFTTHVLPGTATPTPRAAWLEYADTAVLLLTLGLAAWLIHRKRSRRGVFWLTLFCLGYFGFYRQGCICPVGSLQNVAQAVTDASYALPITVAAFFFLPLIFALFFGRVFCAAVCPLGAIQDVVVYKPIRLPHWLRAGLGAIPVLFLGVAVLFATTGAGFLVCQFDPFVGFFRRSGAPAMLMLGGALLVLGLFVARPYCRFVCPYSVLLNFLSRPAKWRVSVTPDECIRCRLCEQACPFDAIRPPALPVSAADRPAGKRRLALLLLLAPALVAGGGLAGRRTGGLLAARHEAVQLADQLERETRLPAAQLSDEVEAFRKTGLPESFAHEEAEAVLSEYRTGGSFLGGYFGLVTALTLIGMSVRRHRDGYDPDPGECLACGRCWRTCPRDRKMRQSASSGA